MLEIEVEKLPSYMMGKEQGLEQGIEQGEHKRAVIVARQLLKLNMSFEQIAQISGLTVVEVERLEAGED